MRWWIEDAQLAAYLYHADAWPTVFHHFASLLTGCTVIGEPCDSTVAPSPLATRGWEKKGHFDLFDVFGIRCIYLGARC